MTDFQKRKLIIIIANILSFLIIITMVLTSKNLSLKASDDTEWYIVEAEYEEPICEDPDGTFTYTEETIYLDEIESV